MYINDSNTDDLYRHERHSRFLIEEQESRAVTESEHTTPECVEVRKPIEEGTYLRRIWGNPNRVGWFMG